MRLITTIFPLFVVSFIFYSSTSFKTNFQQPTILSKLTFADDEAVLREKWDKAIGTFQFQIVNSRISPQIHVSIIETIEKNRHDSEIIYIPYSENIRIKILPKNTISSAYDKLETFMYITE